MKNNQKNIKLEFLNVYFQLFGATIDKFQIKEKKILGRVSWVDAPKDYQDFIWYIPNYTDEEWQNLIELTLYLGEQKLVDMDQVSITEIELIDRLILAKWEKDVSQKTIDLLFFIEVNMVDDGVETDSFFLHF